jgi:superfamily II DNA or RNA helicase
MFHNSLIINGKKYSKIFCDIPNNPYLWYSKIKHHMQTLTTKKHGLTKTTVSLKNETRANEWFKKRGMDIRDYQDKTITLTIINDGDKVVWAVSPNGGKTEMAICFIDLYLQDNPTHKVFVSTHNTIILGNNFYDRVLNKNPTFTHQLVTKDNEIDFTKQVIVSLPSTLNRRKLPKFDLVVIDEAHQMYESDYTPEEGSMVKRIIKKSGIKKELLLTGTPSYFVRKNQEQKREIYKMFFVPMSKVYDAGGCSDVIVEMAGSSYYITDKDYRGDEIKDSFSFKEQETNKTLDDVNQKIYSRIVSPFRNSRKYSNKELFKPLSIPLDWSIFRKKLGKTLIACRNEPQAKKTADYYKKNGVDVALSTYKDDKDNKEIERFQTDPNCKILVVVFRGILGFSFNEIENVIDMSLTKNINRMYQLFCRATRKLEGVDKLFIKVIPSDREPHFRVRLTGMLCLMHEEWFSKFNGKNFLELDVPSKTKRTSGGTGGGTNGGTNKPKKEPFPMLGLPSMSLLKDLYTKKDELYSPICWSTVGTIMRDLNVEVGKRGNITLEVIEDLYSSFKDKSFKEMNISGNSHIIGKARELNVHYGLMQKYNIKQDKYFGDKDYSVLLTCKNNTEAQEKYNAELQALWKTKDNDLIQQYVGHFEKLRVKGYSKETLDNFFNLLSPDEFPKSLSKLNCEKRGLKYDKEFNGLYRAVFHRNVETYYSKILEKWGDKVPMLFLKENDKIKRVEMEMELCKIDGQYNYSFWYKNYKSSHQGILERNNKLDLVDKFNMTKKHSRQFTEKELKLLLKPFKGKMWGDFRKKHSSVWSYINDRTELKDRLFVECGLVEHPNWIKRKNNKLI